MKCSPSLKHRVLRVKRIGALLVLLFGLYGGTGGMHKVRAQLPSVRARGKGNDATKWWHAETLDANGATARWILVELRLTAIYDPPGQTGLCR